MDNVLNLGFPLLSREIPRVLNSIAIWVVVIDAVCDFTRYASYSFKMRKYYYEDRYIAMALEGVKMSLILEFLASVFNLSFLNSIMIYVANLVFLIAICSLSNVTLLCISKFDYSKILGTGDNYNKIMADIRNNRTIGGILLAIVCIVLRLQIALFDYNFKILWIILVVLTFLATGKFNSVIGVMNKHLAKKNIEN